MSGSANITRLQGLIDLRTGFLRFGTEVTEELQWAEREITTTLLALQHEQRKCEEEVRRCEDALKKAEEAYGECMDAAGLAGTAVCAPVYEIVLRARRDLRKAEAELHEVKEWQLRINTQYLEYRQQIEPLRTYLSRDLPAAGSLLDREIDAIQKYESLHSGVVFVADGASSYPVPSFADAAAPVSRLSSVSSSGATHPEVEAPKERETTLESTTGNDGVPNERLHQSAAPENAFFERWMREPQRRAGLERPSEYSPRIER